MLSWSLCHKPSQSTLPVSCRTADHLKSHEAPHFKELISFHKMEWLWIEKRRLGQEKGLKVSIWVSCWQLNLPLFSAQIYLFLPKFWQNILPSHCRQCHGHEFCLTTKCFTKLNTMRVKTWIIIGLTITLDILLNFLSSLHSFIVTTWAHEVTTSWDG